jgi:hypothetical protein
MRLDKKFCDNCQGWHLICNEVGLISASSQGVVDRTARIMSEAHDMPFRVGVKYIMDQVGYEEELAMWAMGHMNGENAPRSLQ